MMDDTLTSAYKTEAEKKAGCASFVLMSRMKRNSNKINLKACPAEAAACEMNMKNTFEAIAITGKLLKCKSLVGFNVCKDGEMSELDCPGEASSGSSI